MVNDSGLVATLLLAAHAVLVVVAAVVISANRRPSSAIAWMIAIVFIPVIGLILFWLVGLSKLPESRRNDQAYVTGLILNRVEGLDSVSHGDEWPAWLKSVVSLNARLGALPMVGGNSAVLLDDYAGSFEAMTRAIDQATNFVHVEFFILVRDAATTPFFDALARARARGVPVRVLSDHLSGFLNKGRRETQSFLAQIGAEWHGMLPLRPFRGQWQRPDLRNHRKLVVVDGRIGFTGSQNLIDASYNKPKNIKRGLLWHELMIQLEGPAVRELNAVFVTDWYSETRELLPVDTSPVLLGSETSSLDAQVLPSGPSFDADNNLKLFNTLLYKAEKRISVTSPYFVPDESILLALVTAAARGLDVELFASEIGDQALVYHAQRSYYEALLRAGVRIFLYRAPQVLHSKHFTIDDDVAVIGSSNMDIRSFSLNMEVSVMLHGETFVDRVRAIEDDYRANSTELHLSTWLKRPLNEKVRDNLARLTSSLQ
jgi:cardiolipin synthase